MGRWRSLRPDIERPATPKDGGPLLSLATNMKSERLVPSADTSTTSNETRSRDRFRTVQVVRGRAHGGRLCQARRMRPANDNRRTALRLGFGS